MDDDAKKPGEPTQRTRPRKRDAKPMEIPVPTRDAFLRDLAKVAPPAKPEHEADPNPPRSE